MSSLYNLEPQPTASCILHTTAGDISLELWAQQIPLTCRNFLQHCIDGYYNNTIFHRLVPGFIIQGGDPTSTGSGGESIYDGAAYSEPRENGGIWPMEDRKGINAGINSIGFKDEWHSRIKYNRRGLLGMANDGTENSNGSQFFITLGDTPELQGKNTLFGRVEGETIYNVAKMGEMEVGEHDRPLYPPKITSVEVLVNPFNDMVRRVKAAPVAATTQKEHVGGKKRKRKTGKQLLSFGGEEGEDTEEALVKKAKKYDTRIVMDSQEIPDLNTKAGGDSKEVRKKAPKSVPLEASPETALSPSPEALPSRAVRLASRVMSLSPEPVENVSSILDQTNAQIAELKASMKRSVQTTLVQETKISVLEEMIPKTSVRGRKRHPGANASIRDERRAVDILNAFRSKLDQAPPEKTDTEFVPALEQRDDKDEAGGDDEAILCDLHFIADCKSCRKWDAQAEAGQDADDDGIGWMSHVLSFREDKLGKDLTYRRKAEEELVVIDPREKARTLKEEKKAQREARSGRSGREWDQAKNDKLARASALAGRGAR